MSRQAFGFTEREDDLKREGWASWSTPFHCKLDLGSVCSPLEKGVRFGTLPVLSLEAITSAGV